ncbi:hypothetical protein Bca4012_101192 [Brassica carinata]
MTPTNYYTCRYSKKSKGNAASHTIIKEVNPKAPKLQTPHFREVITHFRDITQFWEDVTIS